MQQRVKEKHAKSINFPMGMVCEIITNSIGEVTDVIVSKGNGEKVRRHVTSLILLLRNCNTKVESPTEVMATEKDKKVRRKAALACKDRLAGLANDDLI